MSIVRDRLKEIDGVQLLYCSACKGYLPFDSFSNAARSPHGKMWRCKNCDFEITTARRDKVRLELMQLISGKFVPACECCGENEFRFLSIDHVNQDGAARRKTLARKLGRKSANNDRSRGQLPSDASVVRHLINNADERVGLQVLCYNCNFARNAHRVCPHKLKS